MKRTPVRLARPIVLLAGDAKQPPTEVRLFAAGSVETTKGTLLVDSAACESVTRAFAELGRRLSFDYEHASLSAELAPDPAEAAKSAGLFDVAIRDGAIWAVNCTWTPAAREKIIAREYNYVSPVALLDDDKRPIEILGCALTNDPATRNALPLMALTGASSESEALARVSEWKRAAEAAQAPPARSPEEVMLARRVEELEREGRSREVEGVIREALGARKLTPAQVALAREMPIALLRRWVAAAPAVLDTRRVRDPESGEAPPIVALSDLERRLIAQHQIDPDAYAAHKSALVCSGRLPA